MFAISGGFYFIHLAQWKIASPALFALCAERILPRATCRGVEKDLRAGAAVHKWSLLIHPSGSVSWLGPNLTQTLKWSSSSGTTRSTVAELDGLISCFFLPQLAPSCSGLRPAFGKNLANFLGGCQCLPLPNASVFDRVCKAQTLFADHLGAQAWSCQMIWPNGIF